SNYTSLTEFYTLSYTTLFRSVFILFDLNIISSSATLIFSYALPHLITSNYVNSKLVGSYRYSFWGEIYETVMAFHLILPTLMSLDRKSTRLNSSHVKISYAVF